MEIKKIPADGLAGLKENFKSDAISGFLVFLLALPLSLGIAKASEFPPVMGLITAIIGGIVVSIIAGSRLTIKGPAAGLIVIVAGAVQEFGHGNNELGWKIALGTIVVAGLVQIIFGVFKLGSLSDFFPASAVHGMLAAIGIIIFSKQVHTLLGVDPATLKGLGPIQLIAKIPDSLLHLHPHIAIIGGLSLVILFGLPQVKNAFIRRIPSPLVVLILAIPLGIYQHTGPTYSLVKIGKFADNIALNVNFSGLSEHFVFIKYVIMFALVGTIESLLTVKAIDPLDPFKRKSDYNKDLIAVGIGNVLSGILGGLPMISEVARSSANVNNGARTRWANFFHGVFLLLAVLLITPVIEMIPNTALAAMLIAVGYRLASPSEFIKTYKIGSEQLLIFIVTIIITLAEDLLLGVAAGILTKILVEVYYFYIKPAGSLFKGDAEITKVDETHYTIKIKNSAVFLNYISLKKYFNQIPSNAHVNIDLSNTKLVDHTFMEQMHAMEDAMHHTGGSLHLIGLDHLVPSSSHPLASRRSLARNEIIKPKELILSKRQLAVTEFAQKEGLDLDLTPKFTLLRMNFTPFNITRKAIDATNLIVGVREHYQFMFTDIFVQEANFLTKPQFKMTVMLLTDNLHTIPDFSLEAEGLFYDLRGIGGSKDIDFTAHPEFSKHYFLTGSDEASIRQFFTPALIALLEHTKGYVIEAKNNTLLIYRKTEIQSTTEMKATIEFVDQFISVIK
jgi:MFS superfamily sulfate permease-like transporter